MQEGKEITNKDIFNLMQGIIKSNEEIKSQNCLMKEEIKQEILSIKGDIIKELEAVKLENYELKEKIQKLKTNLLAVEKKQKKYNIILYGLKEKEEEVADIQSFLKLVNTTLEITCKFDDFRDIHRIGQAAINKCRPLIVEVGNYKLKSNILQNSSKLKGSGIFISHDYTTKEYEERKVLHTYLKKARANNFEAKIRNNTLIVNGDSFTYEDLVNQKASIPQQKEPTLNNEKRTEEDQEVIELEIREHEEEATTRNVTLTSTQPVQEIRQKRKPTPSVFNINPVKRSNRIKNSNVRYFN